MNYRMVSYIIGQIVRVEGILMIPSLVVSVIYGESAFAAFDMEFSGLETKSYHKSVAVDTVPFPDLTHA